MMSDVEDAEEYNGDGDSNNESDDNETGDEEDNVAAKQIEKDDGENEDDNDDQALDDNNDDVDEEGGDDADADADADADEDEEDLSKYFESALVPINEKERETKTVNVTYKEAAKKSDRRTLALLTKYEKAKIIGIRGQQIAMGSFVYLSEEEVKIIRDPLALAQEELRQKNTPMIVRRTLLDSKKMVMYEDWFIEDLIDPFD